MGPSKVSKGIIGPSRVRQDSMGRERKRTLAQKWQDFQAKSWGRGLATWQSSPDLANSTEECLLQAQSVPGIRA